MFLCCQFVFKFYCKLCFQVFFQLYLQLFFEFNDLCPWFHTLIILCILNGLEDVHKGNVDVTESKLFLLLFCWWQYILQVLRMWSEYVVDFMCLVDKLTVDNMVEAFYVD